MSTNTKKSNFENCCFRVTLYFFFAALFASGLTFMIVPSPIPSSAFGYDYYNDYNDCPDGPYCTSGGGAPVPGPMMPSGEESTAYDPMYMIAYDYNNYNYIYIYEGIGTCMMIAGFYGFLLMSISACVQKVCCCGCLQKKFAEQLNQKQNVVQVVQIEQQVGCVGQQMMQPQFVYAPQMNMNMMEVK